MMEYEHILLPVDFSDYSESTLELVPTLPGVRTVTLLHVVDANRATLKQWISGKTYDSPIERALGLLKKKERWLEEQGLKVNVILKITGGNEVAEEILRVAGQEHVSLIAIGARGKGIIDDLLLGSVSSHVLTYASGDVLIGRFPTGSESPLVTDAPPKAPLLRKILCPTDFSRPSMEVLAFLKQSADISEIVLLHVIQSAESQDELDSAIEEAGHQLSRIASQLSASGIRVSTFVRTGNPPREIRRLAEEEGVSLVVMARRGRMDYISNVPLGSITAEVAKRVERPFLVCRPDIELEIMARELGTEEFGEAENIWRHYHDQHADPAEDRIFGVFVEGTMVGVARCKRHPDGREVDGVFVLREFRHRGYARRVVDALVDAVGDEALFMHSTLDLVEFYRDFGFEEIDEEALPPTIRARFGFALGEMEGVNVQPMRREPAKENTRR